MSYIFHVKNIIGSVFFYYLGIVGPYYPEYICGKWQTRKKLDVLKREIKMFATLPILILRKLHLSHIFHIRNEVRAYLEVP